MHIEVVNFTGHESNCTLNYYDHKGDYLKTYILEELVVELRVNIKNNHTVTIKSCKCTYFDELYKNGIIKTPKLHEIKRMEKEMTECVDWETWMMQNQQDVDDFMLND